MSWLPVMVADVDWYQRARFRLYLDDCGYATAEFADGALLTRLMHLHLHPLIIISAVHLPISQDQTFLTMIQANPALARRHGILMIGEEACLANMPYIVALPTTVDRATFTHAVSQVALRLSLSPHLCLPTLACKREDAVWHESNGDSPTCLLP